MAATSTLSPSGLPTVDARWGGLEAGGAYLLVGRAGAGRSALALQAAAAAFDGGGRALLISPRAPEALAEIGTEAGLDLRAAHATGRLRLLRIPSAADLAARGSDGLDRAYRDLAALVATDRPDRVVVEDLTPLVQFDTFDRFGAAFAELAGTLREAGVTLVVGLGEPANAASEHLLGVVRDLVDGTVTLDGETRRLGLHRRGDSAPTPDRPEAGPDGAEPAPGSSSDGASVDTHAPAPYPATAPAAAPPRPAPAGSGSDALPRTRIVPPPDADPSLLAPVDDPYDYDPAASMFEQGYLVDSGANGGVGFVPPSAAPPPDLAPTFAPLGSTPAPPLPGASVDPAREVDRALTEAFAARAQGTPFLVVAVRMEPAAPESAHFFAIADGLRRALRPADRLLVDLPRRRAVVVLPGVGADGAGPLFAGLQEHLRSTLGPQAEGVLRAIGAVSVPDGQPFTTAQDVLAYAYES
jgi:KaiC/GvpD/RAD55 family RecA-like ATPase